MQNYICMSELHIVDLGVYITFQGVLIRLPLNCETQQGLRSCKFTVVDVSIL